MNDPSRRSIKGYELLEKVGEGGFGMVFHAFQPAIGREVAIKVILPEHANQPEFVRQFEIEAQVIARLEHPHIVPLYDFWRDPDGAYLVMRWLPSNLHKALERGAWSLEATARLLDQIARALNVAHREGIVHRDIKPGNILLDEDKDAYLADFGIAKNLNRGAGSEVGMTFGSPAYFTPEQIKGEAITPRSDIYSLGLVIYEMLVDEKPYPDATTPEEIASHHLNTPLPLVRTKQLNLPVAVDEVLQTATAKNPEQRYANVLRFAATFRAAVPNLQRMPGQPLVDALTQRELDIVRLMEKELTNDEIAKRLFLSLHTIKPYTRQIYTKLDVHSRQQAVERARALGLLDEPKRSHEVLPPEPETKVPEPRPITLPELVNPYKGLRAFQKTDADVFFGRAALTEQLLSRLASSGSGARFLVVVGPSGSGKSSVVNAGLIPALRNNALPNSSRWFYTEMLPGTHPLEELEAALLRVSVNPLPGVLQQLAEDRRGLVRAIKRTLPDEAEVELLLVIDQFEELFTLVNDEPLRAHFIDNLLTAVTDPRTRVRVVLTLRADFYDRPLLYPRLAELVRSHSEVIVPLDASELEHTIVGPAERVGLSFDRGLVATMLKDVGEQPGTLPLLEYALSELYERRQDRLLTLAAYHELGGISGALTRRADDLFVALDEAGQFAARQLFLRLVTLGEGTEDTRRRVLQAELVTLMDDSSVIDDVIEMFSQYRLLTLDRDPLTRGPTVEIAHEALIREWGRLRDWLNENRDALRVQRRLLTAAADWAAREREAGFLTSGAWLIQFQGLAADSDIRLTQEERDYLDASLALSEQQARAEQERQARELELAHQAAISAQEAAQSAQRAARSQRQAANRLRSLVGFLVLFLVVAAGLSIFAFNSRADAIAKGQLANNDAGTSQANFSRAEAERLAADSNSLHLKQGNTELIDLLALRSMDMQYTPQGDEALTDALFLDLPTRVLSGDEQTVNDIDYSPDGKTLLTANGDSTATLWDVATGKEIHTLSGHTNTVWRARFSPDGKMVATASTDDTVGLWNAATGQELHILSGHTDGVESVAWSPDGKTVVSGADDKTVRLWDVATGKEIREFNGHTDQVNMVAFSPDGKTLFTGSIDKTVRLWDVASGQLIRTVNVGGGVYSLGVSHDGKQFVTGTDDLVIRIWDVQSGQMLRQMPGHSANIRVTVFSPDDRMILSCGDDGTVRLWDAQTGQQTSLFTPTSGFVWGAAFAPDGRSIASINDGQISLWTLEHNPDIFQFGSPTDPVTWELFSPDGKMILTGHADGTARLWNIQTGQQVREFANAGSGIYAMAYSPDGKLILTSQDHVPGILWNAQTGQMLHQFTSPDNAQEQNVAFSPDSRYALVGDGVGIVHILDTQTWQEVRRFIGHGAQIFSVAYAPDGKTVFTGTYDQTARLWNVADGAQIFQFNLNNDIGGNSTAYSPDGKLLAAGTWAGSVWIWNAATGALITRLVGQSGQVMVTFSADGKYLVSSGSDGTIRLWDVNTWQEVRRLVTTSGGSTAISPDSRFILDMTGATSAQLVPVDYHQIVQEICARLPRDFTDDERTAYEITNRSPTCPASSGQPAATPAVFSTPTLPVWTPLAPMVLPTTTPEVTSNP